MNVIHAFVLLALGGWIGWGFGTRQWKTGVHVRDWGLGTDPDFVDDLERAIVEHHRRKKAPWSNPPA